MQLEFSPVYVAWQSAMQLEFSVLIRDYTIPQSSWIRVTQKLPSLYLYYSLSSCYINTWLCDLSTGWSSFKLETTPRWNGGIQVSEVMVLVLVVVHRWWIRVLLKMQNRVSFKMQKSLLCQCGYLSLADWCHPHLNSKKNWLCIYDIYDIFCVEIHECHVQPGLAALSVVRQYWEWYMPI